MTEDDDPAEASVRPTLDARYISHYQKHVSQFQRHLIGSDGPDLPPFYLPPAGHWTPAEKNSFFHALSIHSRLRPDLIAECIKTKTVVDVCVYIDALESAQNSGPPTRNKRALPAAMEVSEAWTEFEEGMAGALAEAEPTWEDSHVRRRRETLVKEGMHRVDWSAGGKARREEGKRLRQEHAVQWAMEDILAGLDLPHLRVIDRLLRDGEQTGPQPDQDDAPQGHAQSIDAGDPSVPPPTGAQIPSEIPNPSHATEGFMDATTFDNIMSNSQAHPPPTEFIFSSTNIGPPPSFTARTPSPAPDPLVGLSPASRIRYQKRQYMRRKKALLTGEPVCTQVGLIKPPGRKAKAKAKALDDVREAAHVTETVVGGEEAQRSKANENADEPNGGHIPRPSKRMAQFIDAGITVDTLHTDNLDLFYLGKLGKFMNTYRELHDVPSEVVSRISAETIRFLHAHIVAFTTELVHRTVVAREQELRLKSHAKVWRVSTESLVASNVRQALEMMAGKTLDRQGQFAGLLERLDIDVKKTKKRKRDEPDLDSEGHEYAHDKELEMRDKKHHGSVNRLHRQIYAPFLRLPASALDIDPLMPLDIDEDALLAELSEEEKLDADDCGAESKFEEGLWAEFGYDMAP
ncbi:hypothetical protein PLICRDRAFT_170153 [Plicaturopsis crispa FD-325 SS-3]|nr:hypothetical protein PLICRDRAFT_170153 [Plicaturopsis crispa FD-325 SS-3]